MDGFKRQAHRPRVPHSEPVDLGASTPPWSLPPIYHQESALRSTQTPEATRTINPQLLYRRSATHPTPISTWPALQDAPSHQSPKAQLARKRVEGGALQPPRQPSGGNDNEDATHDHEDDDDDDAECHVDQRENRDSVYMINAKEGSWSGPLDSENDPQVQASLPHQAVQALQKMKRDEETAVFQRSFAAADAASRALEALGTAMDDPSAAPRLEQRWQTDLHLRNIMRGIKQRLGDGAVLTVEYQGRDTLRLNCGYPLCDMSKRFMTPGAYYVRLAQTKPPARAELFCLACLESLWNGEGMMGPLPNPEAESVRLKPLQTTAIPALDGLVDDSLVADRLAATGIESSSATPASDPSTTMSGTSQSPSVTGYSVTTPEEFLTSREWIEQTRAPHVQSPLSRKLPSHRSNRAKEADNLSLGFGEAFFDGQVKVARKRGEVKSNSVEQTGARRSTRLLSASNEQLRAEPESPASPTLGLTEAFSSTHISKQSNVNTVAGEVARSAKRLEEMYERRDAAVKALESGDRAVIRLRKSNIKEGPNSRYVSVDMFGIQCTDLLSDHIKYVPVSPPYGMQGPLTLRPLRRTSAEEPKLPKKVSNYVVQQQERWCTCHGVDDGSEMLSCANADCLIGWFHTTCVLDGATAIDDDDEDWLCALCTTTEPSTYESLTRSEGLEKTVDRLSIAEYVRNVTKRPYGLGEDLQEGWRVRHTLQDISTTEEYAMRLDGSSDLLDLTGPPPQPSSQSQVTKIDPNSLLGSMHAPPPEELGPYMAVREPRRTPTPPIDELPETPGGPYAPGSTTSEGEWRSPPTRFQYLAAFIQPGSTLNQTEKANLQVWKAASKEQLHWEQHLETAQQLRECFAGLMDEEDFLAPIRKRAVEEGSELEDGEIDETAATPPIKAAAALRKTADVEEEDDIDTESANVSISECRGKDLSTILAEARDRNKKSN